MDAPFTASGSDPSIVCGDILCMAEDRKGRLPKSSSPRYFTSGWASKNFQISSVAEIESVVWPT